MSKKTTQEESKRQTRVVGALEGAILFDEEAAPLPAGPSTGMLIARVTERIAQAGYALQLVRRRTFPQKWRARWPT